jgi:hypothetical protein
MLYKTEKKIKPEKHCQTPSYGSSNGCSFLSKFGERSQTKYQAGIQTNIDQIGQPENTQGYGRIYRTTKGGIDNEKV